MPAMAVDAVERELCEFIESRHETMIDELRRYVAIPTGMGYAPGLEEFRNLVAKRLSALGASTTLVAGQPRPRWLEYPPSESQQAAVPPVLCASHRAKTSTPRVLITGHLDTVHDPNGSFRELSISADGRAATGPGAVDMKGGIVIGLTALEAVAACGIDLNWTKLLNSDEETGSFHSHDAIFAASKEHDIGIALEPAMPDGSLVVQRLGSGQFQIEVHGKAAHAGRDFTKGISAVNALGEILVMIAKWSQPSDGLIVNVGPLLGGQTTNIVPDYAACWGNMRFADDRQARELQSRLSALRTKGGTLPRIEVHQIINRPPKPLIAPVQKLADAAQGVARDLEIPLNLSSSGGVSDGNIMQAAGLPTIDTFGARGGNLHRTDEFIELESLVERGKLLAVLLARVARGAIHLPGRQ